MPTKKATSSTTCTKKTTTAKNPYKSNGLTVSPLSFSAGDKIKVTYNGILSQSGASDVYAHIGWGNTWENVDDVKMSKTKSGFTATITAYNSDLNLCFKDTSNNWDNNNGYNYTLYAND